MSAFARTTHDELRRDTSAFARTTHDELRRDKSAFAHHRRRAPSLAGLLFTIIMIGVPSAQQPADQSGAVRQPVLLKPTVHPRISEDPSKLWMAPARRPTIRDAQARAEPVRGTNEFAAAVKLE